VPRLLRLLRLLRLSPGATCRLAYVNSSLDPALARHVDLTVRKSFDSSLAATAAVEC
jgi:hypothetical protein